jgi:hypothetical protein
MTLDVSKPTDQVLVGDLPTYIRQDRVEINSVVSSDMMAQTDLTVTVGTTSLTVGTDLSVAGYETSLVTGTGISTLETILGGSDGQIKVFMFLDSNVRMLDGDAKELGKLYLNQMPAGGTFTPQQDDIIAFRNYGGDGASVYGWWKEYFRTISIK